MMGCYGPSGSDDAGPGIERPWEPHPIPISVTYIVGEITIPSSPSGPRMDITPGFNLDARVSDGAWMSDCQDEHLDHVSPQGERGIDNQLVGALGGRIPGVGDLQSHLEREMARGALLLAIRVNDLESFETDAVTIDFLLVDPQGCAASPCAPTGGAVSAGATWTLQADGMLATGLAATIDDGVLWGGPLDLPLSFEASGMEIHLVIRDARVGGDISASGLANGNLGGALVVEDLVALAESVTPGTGDAARPQLEDDADLSPTSDPMICGSISAGIGFTAVAGQLSDEPAAQSLAFLITELAVPRVDAAASGVIGIDLDERVTVGDEMASDCRERHADRISPSGEPGIDNQLAASLFPMLRELAPDELDLDHGYTTPIERGEQLYAIRLSELDDLANDPDVRVDVLRVVRPDCDEAPCPLGELATREAFDVEGDEPIASELAGVIRDGRLRVVVPSVSLAGPIPLVLERVVVDVAVSDERVEGLMAGEYPFPALVAFAESLSMPLLPMDHTPLQRSLADMVPSASDPALCESISAGMTIEATRITLSARR